MDWKDIYYTWRKYMEDLYSQVDDLAPFESVQLNVNFLPTEVDWWPKSERSRYLDDLKRGSRMYWETRKGILHTAELLFAKRGSAEWQAAVLILASIDVKMKDMTEGWAGKNRDLMLGMMGSIRSVFPDIAHWHRSSPNALPVTIGRYSPARDFIIPKNEDEILYHFAIEESLSLGNWQLIRYLSKTTEERFQA